MFNLPFFGKEKLRLAFEYGLVLSETAHKHKVELTSEMVEKAEKMIENECRTQNASFVANQMIPNIMSIFELDITK